MPPEPSRHTISPGALKVLDIDRIGLASHLSTEAWSGCVSIDHAKYVRMIPTPAHIFQGIWVLGTIRCHLVFLSGRFLPHPYSTTLRSSGSLYPFCCRCESLDLYRRTEIVEVQMHEDKSNKRHIFLPRIVHRRSVVQSRWRDEPHILGKIEKSSGRISAPTSFFSSVPTLPRIKPRIHNHPKSQSTCFPMQSVVTMVGKQRC